MSRIAGVFTIGTAGIMFWNGRHPDSSDLYMVLGAALLFFGLIQVLGLRFRGRDE